MNIVRKLRLIVGIAAIVLVATIAIFLYNNRPDSDYDLIKEKLLGTWISDSENEEINWYEDESGNLVMSFSDKENGDNYKRMIADLCYNEDSFSLESGNILYYEAAGEMTCKCYLYLNGDEMYTTINGKDLHLIRSGVTQVNLDHSRFYVEKRMELLGSWIDTESNHYLFEGHGKQADFGLTAYVKDNKSIYIITDIVETTDSKEISLIDYDYVILATDTSDNSEVLIPIKYTDSGIDLYLNETIISLKNLH